MHVDRSRCKGCKKCIEVCPNAAIRIIKKKAYIFRTRCKECSLCINACFQNAIKPLYIGSKNPAYEVPMVIRPKEDLDV